MSQLEFQPMLTPKEMLEKGIFGGTYFAELIDHRDFPEDWFKKLDETSEEEEDMLDLVYGLSSTSRLGCQIIISEDLDGLILYLPDETHNKLLD